MNADPKIVSLAIAKNLSKNPSTALVRPQWQTSVMNPKFGNAANFWAAKPDGTILYEAFVRYETPGEISIVVRESDGAIAFISKDRPNMLPKNDGNIAWRNAGNTDILTAPNLGMENLEVTRGWVYNPNSPWKLMTEGQEETGLVVEGIVPLPHLYANTGIDSSWIDMSFGWATNIPYGKTVDEIEKVEIKKVVWLTPAEVRQYMLEGNCALSKAALGTFRVWALQNGDDFLKKLGEKL